MRTSRTTSTASSPSQTRPETLVNRLIVHFLSIFPCLLLFITISFPFFCSSFNKKRKKHFCYFRCLGSTWTQLLCRYFRTGRWSMVNLCPPSSHYHCFKHFLRATDSLLIRLAHYLYLTGITGAPLGIFREGGGSFGHIWKYTKICHSQRYLQQYMNGNPFGSDSFYVMLSLYF